MFAFLVVLLWILLSACSILTRIDGTFDSTKIIPVFTDTYATAVFGAVGSAEYGPDYNESRDIVLLLFIILSFIFIIFMNAMIAFIGEEFANILDYKSAILAREKASIIVDMYCAMGEEERRRVEEQCKWVYKLFKQTDLNKMQAGEADSGGGACRATKKDIQGTGRQLAHLKRENSEMKKSLDKIHKENVEMRKESGDIMSSLKKIEAENGELKETLGRLVTMISESESRSSRSSRS